MSKKENLYIDIHVLQTVPPSCVNRDDTGCPKTCVFGGVRRARVSSQAWKRAVRMAFREMYETDDCADRTKNIVGMVEKEIKKLSITEDAGELAIKALEAAGLNINNKEPKKGTDALFFMSIAQAKALATIAVNEPEKLKDKERCKKALINDPSIDMALFGRMVAGDPSLKYDAAAMVAHSISTHKIQQEYDFFTAVDDLSEDDNSGAGYLDTVEYNSSTLYRYASVNVRELFSNLGDDTIKACRNFIEAFLRSMPTGKIKSFANLTVPNAVYVAIRKDQPVNMAPAFEKPISMGEEGGFVAGSEKALSDYAEYVYSTFVSEPGKAWVVGEGIAELGEPTSISKMLEEVEEYLTENIAEVQ